MLTVATGTPSSSSAGKGALGGGLGIGAAKPTAGTEFGGRGAAGALGPGMFGGLGIGGTTPTPTAGTEFGRRAAGALGPTTVGGASGRTCEELFHGRPRLVTMVPQNQK